MTGHIHTCIVAVTATALAGAAMLFGASHLPLPAPELILFFPVVVAARAGIAPGYCSGAVAVGTAVVGVTGTMASPAMDWSGLVVLACATLVAVPLIGRRTGAKENALAETSPQELIALRAAFDQIDVGVLLLDSQLRAQFINRAMRNRGQIPDEIAARRPTLGEIMQIGCEAGITPVPRDQQSDYLARRIAQIQAGDTSPHQFRMSDGQVAHVECAVLPGGGRVMVYTNITDVVRRNEELEILRSALNQIDHGVLLLNRNLQIVFMNRAVRQMGHLRPLVPGERPFFSDLLRQMAVSGVYASAPDNTEAYVASRLAWVQEDNPAPLHVRMTDGKTLCVRCVILRNGTRVILYTDETETMQQVDKLEELASQDSMTGLHNRRRFLELAESEWSRHRRHQRPLSLLMLDIDHFKLVNDNFGHDVGDRLISQLGAICSDQKRQSDIAARFGGEEFVLLLPETSLSDAAIFADRLRTAIANQPLAIGEYHLDMTVSIGVAEATPEMADLSVLIKRADTALYAAKRGGRNRVCTITEVESAGVAPASAA